MSSQLELALKHGLDVTNYCQRRRDRARLLCEHLTGCAVFATERVFIGGRATQFASFDEAVEDIRSVADKRASTFVVHSVAKVRGRWVVFYKTIPLDKSKKTC